MARTLTIRDEHGNLFQCTVTQWHRIHAPAGRTLEADPHGLLPSKAKTTTSKSRKADPED